MIASTACPFCPGPSAVLDVNSHDGSCPARAHPVTGTTADPDQLVAELLANEWKHHR